MSRKERARDAEMNDERWGKPVSRDRFRLQFDVTFEELDPAKTYSRRLRKENSVSAHRVRSWSEC
jgi:hypothetical protein